MCVCVCTTAGWRVNIYDDCAEQQAQEASGSQGRKPGKYPRPLRFYWLITIPLDTYFDGFKVGEGPLLLGREERSVHKLFGQLNGTESEHAEAENKRLSGVFRSTAGQQ